MREQTITIFIEFGETKEDALKRVQEQKKITDEQLKEYKIIFTGNGTWRTGQWK